MKRFISVLFITILLTSAICSCRSSKESEIQTAQKVEIVATDTAAAVSTHDIISLMTATSEFELSDIRVEFFPPDSLHPEARAAPRTLSIGKAYSKNETENFTMVTDSSATSSAGTLNAISDQSSHREDKHKADALRPDDWLVAFAIAGVLIIISVIQTVRYREK